jgi:CHAT domain-containing protein/tetratricopeptide (TPR) repeat protein
MKLRKLIVFCGVVLSQAIVFSQTAPALPTGSPSAAPMQWGDAANAHSQNSGAERLATAEELNRLASVAWIQGDLPRSEQYFRQALDIEKKLAPGGLSIAKSLGGLGDVAEKRGHLTEAEEHYQQALSICEKLDPADPEAVNNLHGLGTVAYDRGDLVTAEEYFQRALALSKQQASENLGSARALDDLGLVAARRGNLAKAEELYRQALDIQEKLSRNSLDFATTLGHLAVTTALLNDVAKAEEYCRQALAVQESLAPGSLWVAGSLHALGYAAFARNDLAQAETYYLRAMAIEQKLAPDSLMVATEFSNLYLVERLRYDLEKADKYEHRSLAIWEKLAPESLGHANSLNHLGSLATLRGETVKAEQYLLRALAIREKLVPDSREVILSLWPLGALNMRRDDAKAEAYYRRALRLSEKIDPSGLQFADSLAVLGNFLQSRNPAEAEAYYRRALSIQEKLIPGSLDIAESLHHLGAIAADRGDLPNAELYQRKALAITEKLAPEGMSHVGNLAALANVMRRKGELEAAAQLFEQTLNAVEGQAAHFGGAEIARFGFRARIKRFCSDYIDLLLEQKRPEIAFQVLERSRSRTLLETLSEAHVDLRRGVDPALVEREHSLQQAINKQSDSRIRLLKGKYTQEQLAAINKEIEELVAEYEEVEGRVRASSPSYAALTQPKPLSSKEVQQQMLDADTLLLEYSLGEERSYVFAVTPDSVDAYALPKRTEIESAARRVYDLLTSRNRILKGETDAQRQARMAKAEAEYPKAADVLSRMVLGPVTSALERKRLLVVSDGALEYIPFALLPTPGTHAKEPIPLIVEHEIVNLPSASVLAALRQVASERQQAPKTVAVLADPVFDRQDSRVAVRQPRRVSEGKKKEVATFERRLIRSPSDSSGGSRLTRLPFSRLEARAIAMVVPQGMQALDFKANRETATSSELGRYRIVHFATHGILDSEHPQLSGLVFSLVDKQGRPQNGFLALHDIYNLNLPADLVVLSACETALGKQINGEGLVGLTRGFMHAGATRVVASLWAVSDVATARLMTEFYKAMVQKRMPPAAALRAAQTALWNQKRWRSPYYWAPFEIQGEWR